MQIRQLFQGSDGDSILSILNSRQIRPNSAGEVFFSEHRPESVFMHGADRRRKASFAIKLEVSIPADVQQVRRTTAGVLDTLVVVTPRPLMARVLELYVRRLAEGRGEMKRIIGEADIRQHLQGPGNSGDST